MPIPAGYATITFTWNIAGSSRNIVNTHACAIGSATTPAQINTAWRTAMVGTASRPYAPAVMSSSYTLVEQKCLANIGGTLYSATDFTVTAYTGSQAIPPLNTAMLVSKDTGLAGRKYRGRFFCPWQTDEVNISAAGIIGVTFLASAQGTLNGAHAALITAGYAPCIIHGDGSTPTPTTGWTAQARIGTIGRRLRG